MLEAILLETIRHLHEQSIPLVQLRPKEVSQQEIDNGDDFDFLVRPPQMLRVKISLVKNAINSGVHILVKENPEKVQITCYKNLTSLPLIIDIWKEYFIRRNSNNRSFYLRLCDLEKYLLDDGHRVQFPADLEALLYITHLSTKRKSLDNSNVVSRCLHYINLVNLTEPSRGFLFGSGVVEKIASIYENLSMDNLDSSSDACLDILIMEDIPIRKRPHVDELRTRTYNAIHRRVSSAMCLDNKIPVVGPDGVGKTTIIDWMVQKYSFSSVGFKSFFRFNRLYPLIRKKYPGYLRHDQNVADESISQLWYWVALFYFVREYWKKATLKGIVIDRYFHDLLLKNVRIDNGKVGFRFFSRVEAAFIPKPRVLIQLYGPPDTIFQRKKELSSQKISEYNHLTSELYCRLSPEYFVMVNTDTSQKETTDFIEKMLNNIIKA